ncbi:hypothetical protein DPMN_098906 [Dreissena polymorpha]|uniref:Uncharacterized protein n=1 Tax=Dreissena polymorpha TaxID=45954 RepID=A0A9D4R7Q8_DREPO|nr:hypothetical protein DPMN_098906 [Dreissena polymorpha]
MSESTSRQELCPICKKDIEISKNKWVASQWKGEKGTHEASVKRKDNLVIEAGTKVHKKKDLKHESALSFLLTSLRTLSETLFYGKDTKRKVAEVGHAII